MTNIVAIDRRLASEVVGFGPSIHHTIVVDQNTPMPDMMRQIKSVVDYPRTKIGMLIIAAHGYAEKGADGKAHDGFGMELCKEDLDMQSVRYFRALEGLFESHDLGITLLGCGVAAQERVSMAGGVSKLGFGESLCKAIAVATMTGVMASSDLQKVTSGQLIQTHQRDTRNPGRHGSRSLGGKRMDLHAGRREEEGHAQMNALRGTRHADEEGLLPLWAPYRGGVRRQRGGSESSASANSATSARKAWP